MNANTLKIMVLAENNVSGGTLWAEHGLSMLIEIDGKKFFLIQEIQGMFYYIMLKSLI